MTAQAIGQVTLSGSYVVVIVCSRLPAIGPEYEEAARDLAPRRCRLSRRPVTPAHSGYPGQRADRVRALHR